MSLDLDILAPTDRPALLGIHSSDLLTYCHTALVELGFKVHIAENHEEFQVRFGQFPYQVIIIEETFGGVLPEENTALTTLQHMPMQLRRHAVIILLGDLFETLNPLQAYKESVHAVVNRSDMDKIALIIQQVVSDATAFLHVYRQVQDRIAEGKR